MKNNQVRKSVSARTASLLAVVAFSCAHISAVPAPVSAQTKITNTGEGVSGDIDKQRRSPTVTISTITGSGAVKILVDAYVADPEFKKYPIQFDFFINRRLFSSQIRSTELPGPIGVDVGSDVATLPFNYTVVAKVLHPNREFTSVLNGAVFASNLSRLLDCTLTTGINGDDTEEYVENDIAAVQTGNNSFTFSFESDSVSGDHSVEFSAAVTVGSGDSASADLSIKTDKQDKKNSRADGEIERNEGGEITSLTLTSNDGDTSISCS